MMSYFHDHQGQQNAQQWGNPQQQYPQQWGNPQQWGMFGSTIANPSMSQAYGQPFGQFGQQYGQPNFAAVGLAQQNPFQQNPFQQNQQNPWGQPQRQLSQQDVGEVVRQLVPLLPQILSQAQTMPTMGYGYGQQGYGYGQQQRLLTQQDVNEVVRQILPIVPQIAAALQSNVPIAAAAMYGGAQQGWGHNPFAQNPQAIFAGQNPLAQLLQQQPNWQQGWPQQSFPAFQSAFGQQGWNQQRNLTQNDVNEVVRQLVSIIPQAIANLQSLNQQRVI
jgi:hypothetical protein